MYQKRYPPVRYFFYPLYRKLRRGVHLPLEVAYVAVWMTSGILHGFIMLLFGNPIPAFVFTGIFFVSGFIGAWGHSMKRRQRRSKAQAEPRAMGDFFPPPLPMGTQSTIGEQGVDPNA